MVNIKFIFLFVIVIVLMACKSEPDLQRIDQLIKEKKFTQARSLIEQELKKEWADTLQYKRLAYRLIKAERGQIFKQIDSVIANNHNQGWALLNALEDSLKRMDANKSRYFYFDLYLRRANLLKQQGQDSLWFKEINKALASFTDEYELKRDLLEQCAFFLAERGKYDQGLKMLDHSFREIKLHKLSSELKEAYFAYLNGQFQKALTLLGDIPETKKDRHWLNLQKYLKQYGHQLSTEERFKLW